MRTSYLVEKYKNVYNKHVKNHKKEYSYLKALRALCEGRTTNPAHTDAFNLLICVNNSQYTIYISLI